MSGWLDVVVYGSQSNLKLTPVSPESMAMLNQLHNLSGYLF